VQTDDARAPLATSTVTTAARSRRHAFRALRQSASSPRWRWRSTWDRARWPSAWMPEREAC